MNKILRALTTIMIGIGFFFIFYYAINRFDSQFDAFYQPSYFEIRSYTKLFLAGTLTVVFTLVASFFSWFKKLDTKKREVLNAVAADNEQIEGWLKDSTLKVTSTEVSEENNDQRNDDNTVYKETDIIGNKDEIQATEIISKEDNKQ